MLLRNFREDAKYLFIEYKFNNERKFNDTLRVILVWARCFQID